MIDEGTVGREWNRNAPQWISGVRKGLDTVGEALNSPEFFDGFVQNLDGKEVIDLGCGEGRNTRLLARRGARMTGIDLAEKMIEAARRSEQEEPLGIQYEVCSYAALSVFEDESFDAAVSTMALMESPDFDRAAEEAFRVLRPGGTLYFSVIHPCFWTRGSRWVIDADGHDQGMLVTDYWIDEAYIEVGRFAFEEGAEPFLIPRFPYRLESYVNDLTRAGLRITQILEPRPTVAEAERHPTVLGPIRRHAPVSLFVAAVKCDRPLKAE
jgi:SAM-dependent methyltransferase